MNEVRVKVRLLRLEEWHNIAPNSSSYEYLTPTHYLKGYIYRRHFQIKMRLRLLISTLFGLALGVTGQEKLVVCEATKFFRKPILTELTIALWSHRTKSTMQIRLHMSSACMLRVKFPEYKPLHGLRLSTVLRQRCSMSGLMRQAWGFILALRQFPPGLFE